MTAAEPGPRATTADNSGLYSPEEASAPDARRIGELEHEVTGLTLALRTRDVIGQAKGVLISHYGLDATSAFALLRRLSQDTNTKLVDVANALIRQVRRRCPNTVQHSRVVTSVLEELHAGTGNRHEGGTHE